MASRHIQRSGDAHPGSGLSANRRLTTLQDEYRSGPAMPSPHCGTLSHCVTAFHALTDIMGLPAPTDKAGSCS
jgi:hypothetical protein